MRQVFVFTTVQDSLDRYLQGDPVSVFLACADFLHFALSQANCFLNVAVTEVNAENLLKRHVNFFGTQIHLLDPKKSAHLS